ncbi:MAG: hypothetical protein PVG92_02980 [Holophagae bacterium]|jgi:hypothetical protein
MDRFRVRRTFIASAWFLLLASASGCIGPGPPPRVPTEGRVSVSTRNIGIPYGPIVLFRADDRQIALRVTRASGQGTRIDYEWSATQPGSAAFSPSNTGRGSVNETTRVGRIAAGPLLLNWSRGSAEMGWIYWPDADFGLEVCSRTFADLEEIDLDSKRLRWYRRDMFD